MCAPDNVESAIGGLEWRNAEAALFQQIGQTAWGQALGAGAKRVLGALRDAENAMGRFKRLEHGLLTVGMVSTAKYFVPRLLGSFCTEHPNIEIALEVLNRDGVVARLRENRDDLYIMSMPPANLDLEQHAFLHNPLVLIAPEGHRLAGQRLELADLAAERFILRERGSGTRLACDAHFARNAFVPEVRLELGSNEAIKQAVAGGLGLAVISRHALPARPEDDQLTILDVTGFPLQSSWFTLYPRGKRLSPIAAVFLEHLKRTAFEWSERREAGVLQARNGNITSSQIAARE